MEHIVIKPYDNKDKATISLVLSSVGWTTSQIEGQLDSLRKLSSSMKDKVFVCVSNSKVIGYISIEIHTWNNLAQIHGLLVDSSHRRSGIASLLMSEAEKFAKSKNVRGIYVDTPANNTAARNLYEALGFKQDYIMTEYYGEGQDGVTFLKLFKK